MKLTSKREQFCQLIVRGKTQTEAYLQSREGAIMRRSTAASAACDLMKVPEVIARIEELRRPVIAKVRKAFEYELDDAMEEIEKAQTLAQSMLLPNVMLQAVQLKSRLKLKLGQAGGDVKKSELGEASTAELIELLTKLREEKKAQATETGMSKTASGLRLVK